MGLFREDYGVDLSGSIRIEALATQQQKNLPHIKLNYTFFPKRVKLNPALFLENQ